jgi:hypothetical protein
MFAWIGDEKLSSHGTRLHYAIRDTFGTGMDREGWRSLPGGAKTVSLGFDQLHNWFVVTYLDDRQKGMVMTFDPSNGEKVWTKEILNPVRLTDVGDAVCHIREIAGSDTSWCAIPVTTTQKDLLRSPRLSWVYGRVTGGGRWLQLDRADDDTYASIGKVALARRSFGDADNPRFWGLSTQGDIFGTVATRFLLHKVNGNYFGGVFRMGNAFDTELAPWDPMGLAGPQNGEAPYWFPALGTYAGTPHQLRIFRATDTLGDVPVDLNCCTPTHPECGPPPYDEDGGFDCEGDVMIDDNWGNKGCPCAVIDDFPGALVDCAVGDASACERTQPDGKQFGDRFCYTSDLVCGETPGGNPVCKDCADEITFGCGCQAGDCGPNPDLICWGDAWGVQGRCWGVEDLPEHICAEECSRIMPATDGYSLVCVGPHTGHAEWSPHHSMSSALHGHPSFCTSTDCGGEAAYCEEQSWGTDICVDEIAETCRVECDADHPCSERWYPGDYSCASTGRCLPVLACDGKPGGCP